MAGRNKGHAYLVAGLMECSNHCSFGERGLKSRDAIRFFWDEKILQSQSLANEHLRDQKNLSRAFRYN